MFNPSNFLGSLQPSTKSKVRKTKLFFGFLIAYYYLCSQIMMLELHNVTIGEQIRSLSMTLSDGQIVNITGQKGSGKTTLLRALLGFISVDRGHISIDGELLTPLSAPYFRRQMAYVPQHLSLPEGYHGVPTDYLQLLRKAVESGKTLLIVDEPSKELSEEEMQTVDSMLMEAVQRGAMVVAVNSRFQQNQVSL